MNDRVNKKTDILKKTVTVITAINPTHLQIVPNFLVENVLILLLHKIKNFNYNFVFNFLVVQKWNPYCDNMY